MFKVVASASLVAVLTLGTLVAQERPDFSGRWILVDATAALPNVPQALHVSQSAVRVGVKGTPIDPPLVTLAIERHIATSTLSEKFPIGVVGGTVGGIDRNGRGFGPNGERPQTRYQTRWDGDRIVIETASYADTSRNSEPYTERDEVWWLHGPDTLVIELTDRARRGTAASARLTYRRLTYENFIAKDVEQRRTIFATLDAETKALVVHAHGERWLATHRARLSAKQIAAIQAFIDFVPELFRGDEASAKRELELTKAIRCEVGEAAFAEAFAVLHAPAERRRSWNDVAYEWLWWFEECVR